MVGSEVVDLLLEHTRPEVFTDEFHHVQLIFESRRVLRQSARKKPKTEETWIKVIEAAQEDLVMVESEENIEQP